MLYSGLVKTQYTRNVARRAVLLAALGMLSAVSYAGTFTFTAGTWSNLTGTAATTPTLYQTSVPASGLGGSLSVSVTSSGTQTLQGTLGFTVAWSASTTGEAAPANVLVTFKRNGTPTIDGNGVAQILQGTTPLLTLDSTLLILSGVTAYLPDATVTVPLTLQSDGTYKATGSLTSDLISVTYNSQSSVLTNCSESFTVGSMEAAS